MRYLDRTGEPRRIVVHGLAAGTFQHEVDHLDGVLILDRIGRGERKEAMRALREAQEAAAGG